MIDTAQTLDRLADALMDSVGHLRRHCRCAGDSICVPCEVATEAHECLDRLRHWKAQAPGLVDALSHVARCVEGITSNFTDCNSCAGLEPVAAEAQSFARSWEESRRGRA